MIQKEDVVSRAAAVARIAVNVEMAYDVIDELARMPEKYPELFARLSRLISKVARDVDKIINEKRLDAESDKILKNAYKRLSAWPKLLEDLFAELESKDEATRANMIRKFAALAVAPDTLTNKLNKILQG
ncbi:CRISPR-associated protein [Pyrobaculum aerophilum]|uniref:CRISPR-associated protein n=1 Tax=Pyrobaculum aerophilum TaxID=13773 RepID=A0A371QUE1_9CREN|nr:CRISPR-associated protein [Pyrobaculum aerophilum]RFA99203.1 CRISPR-associated protein [Pyrobaculum aerophilum]